MNITVFLAGLVHDENLSLGHPQTEALLPLHLQLCLRASLRLAQRSVGVHDFALHDAQETALFRFELERGLPICYRSESGQCRRWRGHDNQDLFGSDDNCAGHCCGVKTASAA